MLVPCVSACALKQGGTLGVTRAPKQGGTVDVTRALKRPPIANGREKYSAAARIRTRDLLLKARVGKTILSPPLHMCSINLAPPLTCRHFVDRKGWEHVFSLHDR